MTTIQLYGNYMSNDKKSLIGFLKETKKGVTLYDNIMGINSYLRNKSLEDVIQVGIECKIWYKENDRLIERDNVDIKEWEEFKKRVRLG